ncbi:MAG: hypothetical protein ACW967_06065 [Candidatus Hodarchaeales archaeon]|jgi:hypothetical protein
MNKSDNLVFNNPKVALIIIVILFGYSFFLSIGLILIVGYPEEFFPNPDITTSDNFNVIIIFESTDINNPITWDPIIDYYNKSLPLFTVLNSSLSLEGKNFGGLGFFISGINGIGQYDDYYWQVYYLKDHKNWDYSAIGVSSIIIDSDSIFKLIFSN